MILCYVPSLRFTFFVIFFAYLMMGFVFTVAIGLAVEQVPEFRGSMMSLNSASGNLGMALGTSIGGVVLLRYDYGLVGLVLGVIGLLATAIYHLNVHDPTEDQ